MLGHALGTGAGAAAGVRGINDSTGSPSPGVLGQTGGSGYGVQGVSPSGFGVYGTSSSGTGVGAFTSTGTALEVAGPIKVSGSKPAAFTHTATALNTSSHVTIIDNPATNNNPTAIVIISQFWEGTYNPHAVGVFYAIGKWRIFNQDIAAMPLNAEFNVLVINQ